MTVERESVDNAELTTLEVVQADNGDIVLRRLSADIRQQGGDVDDNIPLVRICFSDEARSLLGDSVITVAQAMIGAGMHCANELMSIQVPDVLH